MPPPSAITMNSASGSSLHANALSRAREVSRSVVSARSRAEFADRLLPRLQSWLGADLAFLVLLDRRSRRPTIFGGTRDLHLRLGRVLRAQPRGLRPPQIDLEAANLSPETTWTIPLESGLVQTGALVLTRKTPMEEFEKDALELLVEGILPHLQILTLHQQLDRAHADLREAQDSLHRHERMRTLGQLAVDVAHDVNNAMSPITAFSSILLDENDLPERTRRYLELIHESGKDVVQMLNRMRDFDSEGVLPFLQPVEIAPLIGQVVEMIRPRLDKGSEATGRPVTIQVDTEADLPLIFGDPVSLRAMLMMLIGNAIDALPMGGRITVSAHSEPAMPVGAPHSLEHIHIAVEDDGEGMEGETLRRCMDPFFTTKGAEGSRLGLSQVKRIVQDHAGRLTLSSFWEKEPVSPSPFPPSCPRTWPRRIRVAVRALGPCGYFV